MSEYLLINILIIAMPLILTFEQKIKFYKKTPQLLVSILTTGTAFILWDIIAAARSDWSFNPEYLSGIFLHKLPLEEILFFITVPYATIFLYETIKLYIKEKRVHYNNGLLYVLMIFSFLLALLFIDQYYTFTVMLFASILFAVSTRYNVLFKSKIYLLWISITYVPFFLVNYILTSLPVVTYSSASIWGFRVLTIPAEDFIYSFVLLSGYLLVYLFIGERWQQKKI